MLVLREEDAVKGWLLWVFIPWLVLCIFLYWLFASVHGWWLP